jgi:hypothetical protein
VVDRQDIPIRTTPGVVLWHDLYEHEDYHGRKFISLSGSQEILFRDDIF